MPTIYVRDIDCCVHITYNNHYFHIRNPLERTEDNLDKSLKAEGLAREDKKALKEKAKIYKKRVVVLALLLVFGVLAVVKYHNFAIENVNGVIKAFGGNGRISTFTLLLPLGISFIHFSQYHMLLMLQR